MGNRSANKADIGILTVIPPELEWTRRALGIPLDSRRKARGGRVYYFREVPALFAPKPYRIALTCIGEAGTAECAAAATSLIHEYRPKIVILVGIAAGIKDQVRIGSVVFSERVWGYEKQAVLTGRRRRTVSIPRPDAPPLTFMIQQDVTNYISIAGMEQRIDRRFVDLGGKYPEASTADDGGHRRRAKHIADAPSVHFVTVASGNKLLRNPRVLRRLQSTGHGRIKVGEMEASGLATACHQENVHWLVIRGVSDFGDKSKSDSFHSFAAQMAAAVVADFVERGLQISIRAGRVARARLTIPEVPTISEMRTAISQLRTATSQKHIAGAVAARMLELSTPFKRTVYRIVSSRISRAVPLHPRFGTRWSAAVGAGVGVLYFSLSEMDALAEIVAHPVMSSHVCAEFEAQLSYVLDLTNHAVLKALDISIDALSQQDYTYSQSIAEAARLAGCEALLVPRSRPGYLPHLVVFDRITTASVLKFSRSRPCGARGTGASRGAIGVAGTKG